MLEKFKRYLADSEKSAATVEKYVRDAGEFLKFTHGKTSREEVISYKEHISKKYKQKSVNSMLSSVNCFLLFIGKGENRVKLLKVQGRIFEEGKRYLTRIEYERLLKAAEGNERLLYLMQAICSTGIRVSEVKYITVESLSMGRAEIDMKGKRRTVILPKKLCKALLKYAKKMKIIAGSVFVTRNGRPIGRTEIWREMKGLCARAGVEREKVFPHNLRHLFARTFYKAEKDVVRLADILGHSSIETTRIYTMETADEQRRKIERLGLLVLKC